MAGRAAALIGAHSVDGIGTGTLWATTEMKDAYVALADLAKAEAEELERARRREQLGAVSGRSELLGIDRYGRRHWCFELGSGATTQLWVQPRTEDVLRVITQAPPDCRDSPGEWQYFTGEEDSQRWRLHSTIEA